MIYNSSVKMAQVCDGTDWIGLGGGGSGGGGITTAGQDREIIYNDGGALTGNPSLVFDKNTTSVGIGVAIPTQQLDVAGTMTSQGLLFKPIAGDPPIGGGGGGGGFGGSLGNLSDVDTTAQANGRVLTYNSTTSKWEAAAIAGGTLAGGTSGYLGVWAGPNSLGTSGTGTAQQLVWDGTNHRLGIGTATPLHRIDVAGLSPIISMSDNAALMSNLYFSSGWKYRDNGMGGYIKFPRAAEGGGAELGVVLENTGGADATATINRAMVILPNGNVGIGTTTPSNPLHVVGVSARFDLNSLGQMRMTSNAGANYLQSAPFPANSNDFKRLVIGGWHSTTTPMLVIDTNGNIGAGIETPTLNTSGRVLQIHESSVGASAIHLTNSTTGSGAGDGMIMGRWHDGYAAQNIVYTYENESLHLGAGSTTSALEIRPNGDVMGAAKTVAGVKQKTCTGTAAPNWLAHTPYSRYMDISTAGCGFTAVPRYFTALTGTSSHWVTIGVTSIYTKTTTSFRVYVAASPWTGAAVDDSVFTNWSVDWMAVGH